MSEQSFTMTKLLGDAKSAHSASLNEPGFPVVWPSCTAFAASHGKDDTSLSAAACRALTIGSLGPSALSGKHTRRCVYVFSRASCPISSWIFERSNMVEFRRVK